MITRPICFLRQFGKVLQLQVNTYRQGHSLLHWYKQGNEAHEKNAEIFSSFVALDELNDEGYYVFYTTDSEGNQSAKVRIYIMFETSAQQVESVLACAPTELPDKNIAAELSMWLKSSLAHDAEQRISHLIYDFLTESGDTTSQKRNSIYYEAYTAERYENLQNKVWNVGVSEEFSIDYTGNGMLHTNGFITDVAVYERNGRLLHKDYVYTKFDIPLRISKPGAYIVRLYVDGAQVNELSFLRFDEELSSLCWKENFEEYQLKDRIAKGMVDNLSKSSITLDDDEILSYSMEQQRNPQYPVVPRLIVDTVDTTSNVKITVPHYGLLHALGSSVSICVKEKDMLFNSYFDGSVPILGESFEFNCAKNFVADDCYFFVKDKKGNMLNKIQLYSPNTDLVQYRNRIRNLEVETYKKRMLPVLEYRIPGCTNLLEQNLYTIANDSSVSSEDAWLKLCEYVVYDGSPVQRDPIMATICEEYSNNTRFVEDFFGTPVVFYYAEDRIVFPPSETPYVLVCNYMDFKDDEFKTDYIASENGAIEFYLYSKAYYIIYAVNSEDYSVSGILCSSSRTAKGSVNYYNMNVLVR